MRHPQLSLSKTVSRVMSWMAIYLGRTSPSGSSNLPESRRAALCFLFGLASDGVYICPVCYQAGGSLLHCPSTLTGLAGGIFLLHCPWSRLRQTLSGILPCEARTFLSRHLSALRQRPSVLLSKTTILYTITRIKYRVNHHTLIQLPPINSRKIEFLGISSLLIPKK